MAGPQEAANVDVKSVSESNQAQTGKSHNIDAITAPSHEVTTTRVDVVSRDRNGAVPTDPKPLENIETTASPEDKTTATQTEAEVVDKEEQDQAVDVESLEMHV